MSAAAPASGSWADVLGEGRLPRFTLICLGVWLNAADSLITATIMPSVGRSLGGYRSGASSICPLATSASAAPVSTSATNHLQATLASTTSVTLCRDLAESVRCYRTAQPPSGSERECGAQAQRAPPA